MFLALFILIQSALATQEFVPTQRCDLLITGRNSVSEKTALQEILFFTESKIQDSTYQEPLSKLFSAENFSLEFITRTHEMFDGSAKTVRLIRFKGRDKEGIIDVELPFRWTHSEGAPAREGETSTVHNIDIEGNGVKLKLKNFKVKLEEQKFKTNEDHARWYITLLWDGGLVRFQDNGARLVTLQESKLTDSGLAHHFTQFWSDPSSPAAFLNAETSYSVNGNAIETNKIKSTDSTTVLFSRNLAAELKISTLEWKKEENILKIRPEGSNTTVEFPLEFDATHLPLEKESPLVLTSKIKNFSVPGFNLNLKNLAVTLTLDKRDFSWTLEFRFQGGIQKFKGSFNSGSIAETRKYESKKTISTFKLDQSSLPGLLVHFTSRK